MKPTLDEHGHDCYKADVQGHFKPLYVDFGVSCGTVHGDGVSFRFPGEGPWVIGAAELREMAKRAEDAKRVAEDRP